MGTWFAARVSTMQHASRPDGSIWPAAPIAGEGPGANGSSGNNAALACLEWLAQCSALIVALDPTVSVDAADRIAGYLWSNERLRNMQPAGAVEFLFAHPESRPTAAP